ncbi:MAG: WG repeat-containing protein [Bacteroidia bacterium]
MRRESFVFKMIIPSLLIITACNRESNKWTKGYSFGVNDTFISRGKIGQKVYNTMKQRFFEVIDTLENEQLKVGRIKVSLTGDKSGSISIRNGEYYKFGVINSDSEFVVPCLFEDVRYLNDSLFGVKHLFYDSNKEENYLWAIISNNGTLKTDFTFLSIWLKESEIMGINKDGETVTVYE